MKRHYSRKKIDDESDKRLAEIITDYNKFLKSDVGPRCKDFSPFCYVCIAHHALDNLEALEIE